MENNINNTNNNEELVDSIEFKLTLGAKLFLIFFSPIIAPIWCIRKFRHKAKTLKIEIKYE